MPGKASKVKRGRKKPAKAGTTTAKDSTPEISCTPPIPPSSDLVIKSPMDPNDYQVFNLSNGLKVLLVSSCEHETGVANDEINPETGVYRKVEEFNTKFIKLPDDDEKCPPESKKANVTNQCGTDWDPPRHRAKMIPKKESLWGWDRGHAVVILTVSAGSLHDPQDFKGMAHLCEHSIFLGTKKYPEQMTLMKQLEGYKGYVNAFTSPEYTTYILIVNLNFGGTALLTKVIDVLVDAITSPVRSELVQKEIQIIDSEFSFHEAEEARRFWQVFRSIGKKNHPASLFGCGNSDTMGKPDAAKRLQAWKERHYAGNYMSLVISAKMPLQELEKLSREYFTKIPSSKLPSPTVELVRKNRFPFDMEDFNRIYKIVPIHPIQYAFITWALPSCFINDFKTKPLAYLRYILVVDPTFIEYLRKKNWALDLSVSFLPGSGLRNFCSPIMIGIQLTDLGLKEICQVLRALFSFLKFRVNVKPDERIFDEMRRRGANKFHYEIPDSMHKYFAQGVEASHNLHRLEDPKFMLTAPELVTDFDPEMIQEALEEMTPENMNLILISKTLEGQCKKVEPIYGTKFDICEFKDSFIEDCEKIQIYKDFQLTKNYTNTNPFRLKNFISPLNSTFGANVILNGKKGRIIYVKYNPSDDGNPPTSGFLFKISCPEAMKNSPVAEGFLDIWALLINVKLWKILVQCFQVGVYVVCAVASRKLYISIGGPSTNLASVIRSFLDTIMLENLVDANSFEDIKKLSLEYDPKLNSKFYTWDITAFILKQEYSTISGQRRAAIEKSTFQDFQNFITTFRDRMSICGLMIGCILDTDAQTIVDQIHRMKFRGLPEAIPFLDAIFPNEYSTSRAIQLPLGEKCLRVKAKADFLHTSIVRNYYAFGILDYRQAYFLGKLTQVMSRPAFIHLRNNENLSYGISTYLSNIQGNWGLVIVVRPQSHRHSSGYVDEKIDAFLMNFRKSFPPEEKVGEFFPYFPIPGARGRMLQLYDDFLLPTGKYYRKLSTQVVGYPRKSDVPVPAKEIQNKIIKYRSPMTQKNCEKKNSPKPNSTLDIQYDIPEEVNEENGYFITNVETLKNSLPAYPRP